MSRWAWLVWAAWATWPCSSRALSVLRCSPSQARSPLFPRWFCSSSAQLAALCQGAACAQSGRDCAGTAPGLQTGVQLSRLIPTAGSKSKEKEARELGAKQFMSLDEVPDASLDVILNCIPSGADHAKMMTK